MFAPLRAEPGIELTGEQAAQVRLLPFISGVGDTFFAGQLSWVECLVHITYIVRPYVTPDVFTSASYVSTTLIGENFQIGHSYFMKPTIADNATLQKVFRHAVVPLVEEYFYNRRDKRELLAEFDVERLLLSVDTQSSPD